MVAKMIVEIGGQCYLAIRATVVNEDLVHITVAVSVRSGCRVGGGSDDAILPLIVITRSSGGCKGGGCEDAIIQQIGTTRSSG